MNIHEDMRYVVGAATVPAVTGAGAPATLRNGTHTRTYLPPNMCIENRLRDTLYAFRHLFYVYCTVLRPKTC